MDGIRQYLLTVITGAIICAIILKISGKGTANTAVVKLLAEVFMLILVVSPLIKIKLSDITTYVVDNTLISSAIIDGESYADAKTSGLIKESVAAYILDKATTLHADIQVEVLLSESAPQVPVGVVIYGDVSPYTKTVLQSMIIDDLGIPEEAQEWKLR